MAKKSPAIFAPNTQLLFKVGVAFLGGVVTFFNRRGGCTRRRNKPNPADYEDFGMADNDYPHHRSPGPMLAAPMTEPPVTTTTSPVMAHHDAYYNNEPAYYHHQDVQQQQQQQHAPPQQYYYAEHDAPPSAAAAGGYYDNSGYYYNAHHPQPQPVAYPVHDPNVGYYKPDLAH